MSEEALRLEREFFFIDSFKKRGYQNSYRLVY
jgi:hypothetical protein